MKHESSEWVAIPGFEKYQINKEKQIRAFYKYRSHNIEPHYCLLKPDGNTVRLYYNGISAKFCLDYLYELCFGIEHVESLPNERWKPIKGYEGYYKISNKGRILSERKNITMKDGRQCFLKEQIVQAKTVINSGYYVVNLYKEKKMKHYLVHRLVAEHFLENPQSFKQVNHKDENKLNNSVDNLEWCDGYYNQNYGTTQSRRIATRLRNNNNNYGYKRKVNR